MAQTKQINGINVDKLFEMIGQVKANPNIAQFKFRAKNTWVDGTRNQAKVKDFYGALQEDDSRSSMIFEMDAPPVLFGGNLGANPIEFLLVALSGSLTTSLVAQAAARGVELTKVVSRYEGDVDYRGFLGISDKVPAGYQNIRVSFDIEADISENQKKDLLESAMKFSPVYNSLAKPVPVTVTLDQKVAGMV